MSAKNQDYLNARSILATDCGSTTTTAILIQVVNGAYRQTHRGEAPTTVEAPFADVTVGVYIRGSIGGDRGGAVARQHEPWPLYVYPYSYCVFCSTTAVLPAH